MNLHLWQLRQSSEQASHAESHEAACARLSAQAPVLSVVQSPPNSVAPQ